MRDIRQDLKERLEAIEADRAAVQKQLEALDVRQAGVQAMLAEEEARIRSRSAGRPELPFGRVSSGAGMEMADLVKMTVGSNRLTFEEIRDEIIRTPYNFGEQKPGRVVQGGILSLVRTGEIAKDKDERYRLTGLNGIPVQGATQ